MKKFYIQPQSNVQTVSLISTICVGSVRGNSPLQYGGAANIMDPNQIPM